MRPVDKLRASVAALRDAAASERIELGSTLGVWVVAQETVLLGLTEVMAELDTGITRRTEEVKQSMQAAVTRVDAEVARLQTATEAARQLMLSIRAENINIKEERLKAGNDLATSLAEQIKDKMAKSILIRERRWNRRQNTSMVALGFGTLFAAFLAGQLLHDHSQMAEVIARCHAHPVVDPDSLATFCAMPMVDGMPGLPPPAAPAGRR